MRYGISLRKASRAVLVDSTSFGIVFVDLFAVVPGVSITRTYPAFAGRTLKTLSGSLAAISYPGGVPLVAVDANVLAKIEKIYVFCI